MKNRVVISVCLALTSLILSSCRNPLGDDGAVDDGFHPGFNTFAVSSISPKVGFIAGGETITINGNMFSDVTAVTIGGNPCASLAIVSSKKLTCVAPSRANETSAQVVLTNSASETASYSSYDYYKPLVITSVTPATGFFKGSHTATIVGEGFQPNINVTWGGVSCSSVNRTSSTQLTCVVPVKNSVGQVNVVLTNTNNVTATLTNGYEYTTHDFNKVETIVGALAPYGYKNGIGSAVLFNKPTKAILHGGYFYISDTGNHIIRRVDALTYEATDFLGTSGLSGSADGVGAAARFNSPLGLAIVSGDLYVADNMNCTIRKVILSTQTVSTIAGAAGSCSSSDNATGLSARLDGPSGMTTDGTYLYFMEGTMVRRLALTGSNAVTTLAGSTTSGNVDGSGATAAFLKATDLVYLNNALYVTDNGNGSLRKVDLSVSPANASTLVGATSAVGWSPVAIATDGVDFYVSDMQTSVIYKYTVSSQTATIVSGSGTMGNVDGIGTAAALRKPCGLTYSASSLYIASCGNSNLRRLNLGTMNLTTLVGANTW